MAGYVRQDTSNIISDNNIISADVFDDEFDAIQTAFNIATGHTHDGSTSEGAPINVTGPNQEFLYDATAIYPKTDDTYDLGKVGAEFKDLYIDGTAYIDALDLSGNVTVSGTLDVTGATTLTGAVTAQDTLDVASTLGVTGATTLSATLAVTGNSTVGGTLGVTGATTLSSTLDVTGDTTLNGAISDGTNTGGIIPSGGIILWSGSIVNIPTGWALCDGTNGTPNLENRFVVGAGNSYVVGETGGEGFVTLTESQIPSHQHGSGSYKVEDHNHSVSLSTNSDTHSHSGSTNSQGFSGNFDIRGRQGSTETITVATGVFTDLGRSSSYGTSDYLDGSSIAIGEQRISIEWDHSHTFSTDSDTHSHTVSGSTGSTGELDVFGSSASAGGGSQHENRPPYYALAYIMKL